MSEVSLPENLYWKDGKIWFSIRHNGRRIQKSSGSNLIDVAKAKRNATIAKLERGELSGGDPDRVRVNALLDDYLRSLEIPKRNYTSEYHYTVTKQVDAHVRPFFGEFRAVKVRPNMLLDYQRKRLLEGASQNTINHELGYLRTAFNLAVACEKFLRNAVPDFVKCGAIVRSAAKQGVRQGIITPEQLQRLLPELPRHLRAMAEFCWWTGVRKKEARFLRWRQVDFERLRFKLLKGETKGGNEETLPLFKVVADILQRHKQWHDEFVPDSQWVFGNPDGSQVKGFDSYWKSACLRAGLASVVEDKAGKKRIKPHVRFHDTRRSAATQLHIDYGMSLDDVKAITRHQTDEIAIQYIKRESKIEQVRRTVDAAMSGVTEDRTVDPTIPDQLHMIASMHKDGLLTDREFAAAKAKVLGIVTTTGYDSGYEKQNAPETGSAMPAST
jgi:integrase